MNWLKKSTKDPWGPFCVHPVKWFFVMVVGQIGTYLIISIVRNYTKNNWVGPKMILVPHVICCVFHIFLSTPHCTCSSEHSSTDIQKEHFCWNDKIDLWTIPALSFLLTPTCCIVFLQKMQQKIQSCSKRYLRVHCTFCISIRQATTVTMVTESTVSLVSESTIWYKCSFHIKISNLILAAIIG